MKQPIAIQSWCFREFKTLDALAEQLQKSGVTATELCGVHADFSKPDTAPGVAEHLKKLGISIVAMGVEYLKGVIADDEPRFAFAKAAGIKHMSISFPPEAMFDGVGNIEKLAEKYDIKIGIHNHGGYDWLGNDRILKFVFSKTKRVGLHMDTAWALDASQDPVKWAEEFKDRLVGVHLKDFVFDKAAKPTDVVIGTGNLKLPALAQILNKNNFSGALVIEYEGDAANPAPALKGCVEALMPLL
jgi:inosose dehydratase